MRYRFTHPTAEDFLRTIEQTAIARGKAISFAPPKPQASEPCTPIDLSAIGPRASGSPSDNPRNALFTQLNQYHVVIDLPANSSPPCLAQPGSMPLGGSMTASIPLSGDFATAPPTNSSLRPFFDQAVYGTQVLDYTVEKISSDPAQWWLPEPKDKKTDPVPLHRLSPSQRRLHPPRHRRNRLRRRHPHPRTLGRSRSLDQNSPTPATPKSSPPRSIPTTPSFSTPTSSTTVHHEIESHPGTQTLKPLAKLQPTRRTSSRLDRMTTQISRRSHPEPVEEKNPAFHRMLKSRGPARCPNAATFSSTASPSRCAASPRSSGPTPSTWASPCSSAFHSTGRSPPF